MCRRYIDSYIRNANVLLINEKKIFVVTIETFGLLFSFALHVKWAVAIISTEQIPIAHNFVCVFELSIQYYINAHHSPTDGAQKKIKR